MGLLKHATECRSIQFFEFMCLSACSCSGCTGDILPAPCLPSLLGHVERTFSLMGHIQTKDRLHMGNNTLRHLAMMYHNAALDRKKGLVYGGAPRPPGTALGAAASKGRSPSGGGGLRTRC